MVLPDVNVLIAAYRVDSLEHERCRTWLTSVVNGDHAFAVSELVLCGFLRIVTNPRVFKDPATFASALEFVNTICLIALTYARRRATGESSPACAVRPKLEATWSRMHTTQP